MPNPMLFILLQNLPSQFQINLRLRNSEDLKLTSSYNNCIPNSLEVWIVR